MSKEDTLQDLLDRYEAAQTQGGCLSAEELCQDYPELLEELKIHIRAIQAMDGFLNYRKQPDSSMVDSANGNSLETARSGFNLVAGLEPIPGYRLITRLGRGGFGEVWKATGPGGFAVALKFVKLDENAGAIENHALEIIKDVRHPNLLATFGAWQQNGFLIIAMELADRTLLDRFEQTKAQNLSGIPGIELLEYLTDAAKGIDFLNASRPSINNSESAGIQHRDIKPQNLLLVGGCVKVADFGLARVLNYTVTGHTGSLTPSYAPPEFFDGKTHRHSDQYSLAVTYCMLRGGRLPFEGNAAQVMAGHLHRLPDLTMLPEEERLVVARALAKNPKQRWPSCGEFVSALRDCKQKPLQPQSYVLRRWWLLAVGVIISASCLYLVGTYLNERSQITTTGMPITYEPKSEPTKSDPPKQEPAKQVTPKQETPKQEPKEPNPSEVRKFEIAAHIFMEFCWIPAGEAQLGSPKEEQDYLIRTFHGAKHEYSLDRETESRRGKLNVSGFWLGKYTVTQSQWQAVMGDNPSWFKPNGSGKDRLRKDGVKDTSRFPVEQVSWNDCQMFLERLNSRTGVARIFGSGAKFTLPHEDQWEYACRGGRGNRRAFYWGNELNGTEANCDGNYPYGAATKGQYLERTCEVDFTNSGKYEKHPWGLCHMIGNVWQWCSNSYELTNQKTRRGGSWLYNAGGCRSANCHSSAADYHGKSVGFRVCVSPGT